MDIKEIRRQTGLSQAQFAEELGIPSKTIKNWEQKTRKAPGYMEALIEEVLISRGYVIAENRADSVEAIKKIVEPIAKQYKIKRVVMFGSRARGDYNGKSDYDFCITKDEGMGLKYFEFHQNLEKALSSHVDLVTDEYADDYILQDIDKEGVVIYES